MTVPCALNFAKIKRFEFVVRSQYQSIILFIRKFIDSINMVLMFYGIHICPRIINRDIVGVFHQSMINVHNFCVTNIGAIFLERNAEN